MARSRLTEAKALSLKVAEEGCRFKLKDRFCLFKPSVPYGILESEDCISLVPFTPKKPVASDLDLSPPTLGER